MDRGGHPDTDRRERRLLAAIVVATALAGLFLRLRHAFAEPLWLDEAYSVFAAGKGFVFLWRVVPKYETHPPFYYALLRCWELAFGDGLAAVRMFGLVAGMMTPPAIAWAAGAAARMLGWPEWSRARLMFAAFALACLSIPLVEMAREVRPYPLMILDYALALRALLALAARRRAALPLASGAFAGYLIVVELMLWLHNLGQLWAAALGLALLVAFVGRRMTVADWVWLAGGHAAVLLLYLPGLRILLDQAPTWVASTWLTFSFATLWTHLAVLYAVPGWQGVAAGALALLAIVALARSAGEARRLLAMLLLLALVPVLLSLGITLAIAPVFITRTMTPVAVPALLLLAIGATAWRGRAGWIGLVAAAMLAANLFAVGWQARAHGPMQDWYGTVAWLGKRFRPGDAILAYPNEGALPMARALRDKGLDWPVRAIPAEVPAFGQGGWYPTGSRGVVSLPRWRLRQIADEPATRALPTIWLLRLGAESYDRGDVFRAELSRGRHIVRRWRDGPIDVIGLGSGPVPRTRQRRVSKRTLTPPPGPDRNRR